MENDKKLELTLCNLLPYGLQIDRSSETHENTWHRGVLDGHDLYENDREIKPLLHSLDKLTEPVLDGGLIPIVELAKISCPDWNWKNVRRIEINKNIGIAEFDFPQCPEYVFGNHTDTIDFYASLGSHLFIPSNQLQLFEKLKEWHFNVFDLPKEMYIEKSTI